MTTLGIVTARGGSQGVPRKNLFPLLGRPLIAYTASAALAARGLKRTILSTDDVEIANAGREWGLDVPFVRPGHLAAHDTPMLPVLQHAVKTLESDGEIYEAVCLLQPTCPLRSAATIDRCIQMLQNSDADSVVTVLPVPAKYNPHWVYFEDQSGCLRLSTGDTYPISRRQDLPNAYHREGSVYVVRRDVLMHRNSLYGSRSLAVVIDPQESVNIDEWADLERAERLLAEREMARV